MFLITDDFIARYVLSNQLKQTTELGIVVSSVISFPDFILKKSNLWHAEKRTKFNAQR